MGIVLKKKGIRRKGRKTKSKNLGVRMRKRGGFLPALLGPVIGAVATKLISGKGRGRRSGKGVRLSGSSKGRGVRLSGRGILSKLGKVAKTVAKKAFNEFKKDPVSNATKAFNLGKQLYSKYKGSGRGRKRRPLLRGVHTNAPGSKTTTTISKHKLVNVPVKTLSVGSIKRATC